MLLGEFREKTTDLPDETKILFNIEIQDKPKPDINPPTFDVVTEGYNPKF